MTQHREAGARPLRDLRPQGPAASSRSTRPGGRPDALARGSAIHAALDAFVAATADELARGRRAPPSRATVRAVLAEAAPWPAVRALWTARLERAAGWFLAGEAARRARARPLAREVRRPPRRSTASRCPSRSPPGPTASTAPPTAATRSTTTSRAACRARPDAAAFHLQLPLEAAIAAAGGFEGVPPGPRRASGAARARRPQERSRSTPARRHRRAPGRGSRALIAHYQRPDTGYVARLRPQRMPIRRRLRPPRRATASGPTATRRRGR